MKLEELEKVVSGMTFKTCGYEEELTEEYTSDKVIRYEDEHRGNSYGRLLCDTGKAIPEYVDYEEAYIQREDAKGIAALRNHAELFLKLLTACKESEKKWMAVDDGFFTGLVPPEFAEISQVIRELEGLGE